MQNLLFRFKLKKVLTKTHLYSKINSALDAGVV